MRRYSCHSIVLVVDGVHLFFIMVLNILVVRMVVLVFFVKQNTAYDWRISDWSSDVCSSDLKVQDPARVQRSTLEIAATWLACGLDPGQVWFYRQSDVPETTELTWLLTCVAGKGVLNRAHAYKAAVDRNRADGEDDDAGIKAGLFMYPVLMSADILLFNADKVPVGRDQVQPIEMAGDFGHRFNHLYGEHFRLTEAAIEEHAATLPGLHAP